MTKTATKMTCRFCGEELSLGATSISAYYWAPKRNKAPVSANGVRAVKSECVTPRGTLTLHEPIKA